MMTPIALAAKAASPLATGLAGRSRAKAQARNDRINAYIGDTRALQEDTYQRDVLSADLAQARAALGGNGQAPRVGTLEVLQQLRETRNRERRIGVGNRRNEASDYRRSARNNDAAGRFSLLGGVIKAGPGFFDLYQYAKGR